MDREPYFIGKTRNTTARCLLFMAAVLLSARATEIGDTYDQVITERGKPAGKVEAGSIMILKYADQTIKLKSGLVVSMKAAEVEKPTLVPSASPKGPLTPDEKVASLKAEMQKAVARVREIVNQPVTQVPRTPGMAVSMHDDGWFHPGSETPDFDNVDIRQFQDWKVYVASGYEYTTSNLNPGVVFLTRELAFNSKTKIFYTDRTLPKKLLTEQEMLEINGLYRIIGRCFRELVAVGQMPSFDSGG